MQRHGLGDAVEDRQRRRCAGDEPVEVVAVQCGAHRLDWPDVVEKLGDAIRFGAKGDQPTYDGAFVVSHRPFEHRSNGGGDKTHRCGHAAVGAGADDSPITDALL